MVKVKLLRPLFKDGIYFEMGDILMLEKRLAQKIIFNNAAVLAEEVLVEEVSAEEAPVEEVPVEEVSAEETIVEMTSKKKSGK